MANYLTPGVYVNEAPLSSLALSTQGVTAAAFFGEAQRGPTTLALVPDWGTYKALYGDLTQDSDLGYAVFHFFANGGRSAYVRRVVDAAAEGASTSVMYYPNGSGASGASATLFSVAAISEGTWGNNLAVAVEQGTSEASDTSTGTFNVVITLSGTEVERWPDVTLDVNGNRHVASVVNNYSRYIRVSAVSTAAADSDLEYITDAFVLGGGTESSVADGDYVTAVADIDAVEGNLILNPVGKNSTTVVSAFVNKAASRGDSFVIIDPAKDDANISEIQATAASFSGQASGGYAAHYAPTLIMTDPAKSGSAAIRNTYPGGAVAGLMVRTDVQRTPAKAPAGDAAELVGALALNVPLTSQQIGTLYNGTPQINSFRVINGAGVTVWGARTLQKINPDKFISVRRILNYVKYNVKVLNEFAVFEPNNQNLWNVVNQRTSGFLAELWEQGGLKGASASEAFYVKCDETNNTPSSMDAGIVNIEVGVAVQYPAEFIVITVSQWTGGSEAVESF